MIPNQDDRISPPGSTHKIYSKDMLTFLLAIISVFYKHLYSGSKALLRLKAVTKAFPKIKRIRIETALFAQNKKHAYALLLTGMVIILYGLTAGVRSESENPIIETEPLAAPPAGTMDESEALALKAESVELPPPHEIEETLILKKGESLIQAVRKAGVPAGPAHNAVNELVKIIDAKKLLPGLEIHVQWLESDGRKFTGLWLRDNFSKKAKVSLQEDGGFKTSSISTPTLKLRQYAEGTINDSLYLSAEQAGIPADIIIKMIQLFSFDVDFQREIRPGDKFAIYFTRSYAQNFDDTRNDDILYARLELGGNSIELNRFEGKNGVDYYDPDGKSARKFLMKTPIDGAKVTSSFSMRRKHPVLGYTRAHKGSDFRARTGTPIMAAGDGIVERASRFGSYGHYIRVRHNGTYKTVYAHLSKYGKGIRQGVRVKQGQIIGYSGATGRVSGPHLHYEVYVNGKRVNPMTLKLPNGHSLSNKEKKLYLARVAENKQERETAKELARALAEVQMAKQSPADTASAAVMSGK